MYYPIIALQHGLEDIRKTRAILLKGAIRDKDDPEIIKVDLHIDQMESAIRLLEGIKKTSLTPEKYIEIYDKYTSGEYKIQELADENDVSYKTIQRVLQKRAQMTGRFGKHFNYKINTKGG